MIKKISSFVVCLLIGVQSFSSEITINLVHDPNSENFFVKKCEDGACTTLGKRSFTRQEIMNLPKSYRPQSEFMSFYDGLISDDLVLKLPTILLSTLYVPPVATVGSAFYLIKNCGLLTYAGAAYGAAVGLVVGTVSGGGVASGPNVVIGIVAGFAGGGITTGAYCFGDLVYDEFKNPEKVDLPPNILFDDLNNEHQEYMPITPEMVRFLDQQLKAIDHKREPEIPFFN